MIKNLMVAQSGGPTTAINASLSGVIAECMRSAEVGEVFGALNGIRGILDRRVIRLDNQFHKPEDFRLLECTPSSALGSCRFKMPTCEKSPETYETIRKVFHELNIGYFLYIGGNDSMDTADKLADYFLACGDDIKVIGVPKTIDNDLPVTDHTPGFGSAAKYIAATVQEIVRDAEVYPIESVTIVEIMGRNAGWLTAAAALPRVNGCAAPHLIYLPEVAFDIDKFVEDVKNMIALHGNVVVAVSEGVKLADGSYVAEATQSGAVDAFGHKYLSGVGRFLEQLVTAKIGCKVRSIELNVMQRCSAHILSATDIDEAFQAGAAAVKTAVAGKTALMTAFFRVSQNPYLMDIRTVPLADVANVEKTVPAEWITKEGNQVTVDVINYILPLIEGERPLVCHAGIPCHFVFDKTPYKF